MSLISRNNTISHYLKCICLSSFQSPQVLVFSSASSMMNLYICIENRQTWKLDQRGIGDCGGAHGCPWVLIGLPSVFIQGVRNSHKSTDPREMVPPSRTVPLPFPFHLSDRQHTHRGPPEQEQFVENKLQLISQKQFHCDASKRRMPRLETVVDRRRKR